MNEQRLSFLFRSPRIVERAVRGALADALAVRRMRLGEIDARSFGNRTLEKLRDDLSRAPHRLDALGVHDLELETVRAAARVFSSKMGRRLLTIEPERLGAVRPEYDASVLDAHGRRHVVRVEAFALDEERVATSRALGRIASEPRRLYEPRIHLLSLRDGRLRSFTFAETARAA